MVASHNTRRLISVPWSSVYSPSYSTNFALGTTHGLVIYLCACQSWSSRSTVSSSTPNNNFSYCSVVRQWHMAEIRQ